MKPKNKWKIRTIYLSIIIVILVGGIFFQIYLDDKKENKRICDIVEGTPAWVNYGGAVIHYGVINSGFKNNETVMNDTELTNYLIEDKIKFVYNENCYYCQIQKIMLGEDNFNRLTKNKLTLECNE